MKTITINGIELAYRDEGTGEPLLLVHAFPLSSAMWERQIEGLGPQYRVIAPDLRGFGASGLGTSAVSMEQYADDLARLLDQLALEQVALGGLSMGGYVVFAFLRRHRDRVRSLILADTRTQADTVEGQQAREQNARLAEQQGPGAIAEQMLPKLLSSGAVKSLQAEVRRMIEANDRAGIAAALRAMAARPDSAALLAGISVPTLVLVGSEDGLTPPSDSQAMHKAIPNSQLVELAAAGHLSNLEAPTAFNDAIDLFLSPRAAFESGGGGGGVW
jgi:pimeloyl-ACP methyl ester carboxylesterase